MRHKPIGIGKTAEVYEYQEKYILKLFNVDFSKENVNYEYQINLEVQKINKFMPKVHSLIFEDERIGLVYDKVSGQSLINLISKEWFSSKKYAQLLAKTHYDLHIETGINLPSNKNKLRESIKKCSSLSKINIDKLCNYIDDLKEEDKLCHGDFHPGNIIVSSNGNYVIDWVTATLGNPHSDVARSIILLKYADIPDDISFLFKCLIKKAREKFSKMYLEEYRRISKVKLSDIEKWELPHMVARLEESITEIEKETLMKIIKKRIKAI